MAARKKILREQRDQLKAQISEARKAERQLSGERQQANENVERARQAYIAAMAEAGDATGGKSKQAANQLEQAEAAAHAGNWEPKLQAAGQIVRQRESDLASFLEANASGLLQEIAEDANKIPAAYTVWVEQGRDLHSRYEQLSAEAGEVLRADGHRPASAIPPNPMQQIVHELGASPRSPRRCRPAA